MAQFVVEIVWCLSEAEIVTQIVEPLANAVVSQLNGKLVGHKAVRAPWYQVRFAVPRNHSYEEFLDLLDTVDVPFGSVVYRQGWFWRKHDIFLPMSEPSPDANAAEHAEPND